MSSASTSRLVLIPSYNTGRRLLSTVEEAVRHWAPVWVVVDGSSDGSERPVEALAAVDPRVKVIRRGANGGKGAAVATGVSAALAAGFTHALTMDSDGQHPADLIAHFMRASEAAPEAMILGRPVFGPEAPAARRQGRKLSIALTRCEILGPGIDDPLFGFRVYPLAALQTALAATRWARGFDFDQEVIVRMFWAGTPSINLPAPCRYLSRDEGGVSHFRYVRDNALLVWLQIRLLGELALRRWPAVVRLRRARRRPLLAALALFALLPLGSGRAGAAPLAPPDPVIAADSPGWQTLFRQLGAGGDRTARFTESRYFPFRTAPVELTGEVRISPRRGFSVAYATPRRRTLIVDSGGLLLRDARGRDRPAPDDPRVRAAIAAMVDILRFDLPALEQLYVLHGSRAGEDWRLSFLPRPGRTPPGGFAVLALSGHGPVPNRIELIRSANERIVITLADERRLASFSPAEVAAYFRR
ncbi:MAG TPA: glycosyltransferase [Opitutaceae bacterium]|jgi:glycosyltransferase involved in cell wall biosynthesis|nr:glycosyltransferase [Opitutaceae bacterium]